jgi:Ni/Fe-hydrogenase subunit HybB-like protein
MSEYRQVGEDVLGALGPPRLRYQAVLAILALGIAGLAAAWVYQVRTGMGVAGISHPVGWGVYIGSFVFWIGIAHSGTLISAILYLVRSKWRTAISRSAEAMTVVAIATAGLFPLIHLGRFWVFYYIIPYPSQRQIWPNFQSPLVFDVVAISTYLTVSVIFFVRLQSHEADCDFAQARKR